MKKQLITSILIVLSCTANFAQTVADLFMPSGQAIVWLGVDFSHVKLVGDFSQFNGAGGNSGKQVRDTYFPAWNHILFAEAEKYDVRGMLRKEDLKIDMDKIMELNSETPLETLESYNVVSFTEENIREFVKAYSSKISPKGIGVGYIAESLNKGTSTATYHFFAINLETKELLLHEVITGKAGGFGLKNFWARTLLTSNVQVKKQWKKWQKKYAKE